MTNRKRLGSLNKETTKGGETVETVCVFIENTCLKVPKGTSLANALRENGFSLDLPCGGTGKCGKCRVNLQEIGEVLACQYNVTKDIHVLSLPKSDTIVTPETKAAKDEIPAGEADLAIDIGTTTVALALVEPIKRTILYRKAFDNPQKAFGADVISRISYGTQHGGAELQRVLLDALKKEIEPLTAAGAQIQKIYVSGNTTMLHLFLGADCSTLGTAPYTPQFLKAQTVPAQSLGLPGETVTTLPCISTFVGADVLAGLLLCNFPKAGKYNLLIDLGTNAEVALFNENHVLCTATAAGPCFEGANISCGMPASNGAITHYVYPYGPTFLGEKPTGICGTGLVDIVSELFIHGIVDETGAMEEEAFPVAPGVEVTAADIRQFQLAKSAVRAGTQQLLELAGISEADVETVYLSGGFSAFLNVQSACKTGLINPKFLKKCVWLGNSSLEGCAVYKDETARAEAIVSHATYIDLAKEAGFSEKFMRYMYFGK